MLPQRPQVAVADGIATVVLAGELDFRVVRQLDLDMGAALAELPGRVIFEVIFDLSQVTYLDCAAAQVIIAVGQLASGRRPVLRAPSPLVLRVLETSDLAGHCEIRP